MNSKNFKHMSSFRSIDLTEKKSNIISEKSTDHFNNAILAKNQIKQVFFFIFNINKKK